MLALRFADVDVTRLLITLRGTTTKSRKTRFVPIATERLRADIEWLRLDAAGEKKPDEAVVFSDEASEPVGSFRTAWVIAVLRAHGVKLVWLKDGVWRDLAPECKAQFRAFNLHWHDLRHEYASRLVERSIRLLRFATCSGMPRLRRRNSCKTTRHSRTCRRPQRSSRRARNSRLQRQPTPSLFPRSRA